MDYIAKAKEYLNNYQNLRAAAFFHKERIAQLKSEIVATSAPRQKYVANYTGEVGASKIINFEHESNAVLEEQKILNNIYAAMEDIEYALESFNCNKNCKVYQDILILIYIKKKSRDSLTNLIPYSSRTSINKLHDKAIKQFAIFLFGTNVIND